LYGAETRERDGRCLDVRQRRGFVGETVGRDHCELSGDPVPLEPCQSIHRVADLEAGHSGPDFGDVARDLI
jgi:hypothetical protein